MSSRLFDEIAQQVNNWGRWGPDDVLGTVNLIDPAARRRAAAAIVDGTAFSLSLPLSAAEGIQLGFIKGRVNPSIAMSRINTPEEMAPHGPAFSEDVVTFSMQCATHIDGLAHVSFDGLLYNGYDATEIDADGATRLGIHRLGPLVTRGILLDVARARQEDILPAGHPISVEDLEAAVELAGIRPVAGDAVCIRTGQMRHLALDRALHNPGRDLVAYTWPAPGLTMETARWLREHDVSLAATDTMTMEVFPGESEEDFLPVHLLHLREMGLTQGQNWVLDELATAAALDGRYCFLLDASPLRFTGAVGSAVTPVAVR